MISPKTIFVLLIFFHFIPPPASGQSYNISSFNFLAQNGTYDVAAFDHFLVDSYGYIWDTRTNPLTWAGNYFGGGGIVTAITYEAPYLYIGNAPGYPVLRIVDVSQVSSPVLLSTYFGSGGEFLGMVPAGSHLFVAAGSLGLLSFDISDPGNPIPLDTLGFGGQVQDVMVHDCRAVVTGTTGAFVVDVADPANMVAGPSLGGASHHITHIGDTVFTSALNGLITAIDLSTPNQADTLAITDLPNNENARGIDFQHGLIYVSSNQGNLHVFDFRNGGLDPFAFFEGNGGQAFDVAVSDSFIGLPDLVTGIHFLRLDSLIDYNLFPPPPSNCTPTALATPLAQPKTRLVPQPFPGKGKLLLSTKDGGFAPLEIEVWDLHGRRIRRFGIPNGREIELEMSDLAPGGYFYRLWREEVLIGQEKFWVEK